jgi:hypothetical protein
MTGNDAGGGMNEGVWE